RKTNDQTGFNSAYVGPNGVAGPVGATNDDNLAQFFDPNYHHKALDFPTDRMQFFDQSKIVRALKENPNYFATNVASSLQDSYANDAKVSEGITAAYIIGTWRVGKLTTVGGVSCEDTQSNVSGWKNES